MSIILPEEEHVRFRLFGARIVLDGKHTIGIAPTAPLTWTTPCRLCLVALVAKLNPVFTLRAERALSLHHGFVEKVVMLMQQQINT